MDRASEDPDRADSISWSSIARSLLQFGKQRTDAPVEATALIGESHGTRGAIKQANSDTLF